MKKLELTSKQEKNITEDKVLVQRVLAGSEHAFAELLNKYEERLFHKFKSSVRDDVVIQDLTMEVFEKVYEKLSLYDEDKGAFSTWFHTIANNHFIDYTRKERDKYNIHSISDLSADHTNETTEFLIESNDNTPIESIEEAEISERLKYAIETYIRSKVLRKIIKMRYFDELSYEEIASKINKPLGTVKANIHRAKLILQEKLEDKKSLFLKI